MRASLRWRRTRRGHEDRLLLLIEDALSARARGLAQRRLKPLFDESLPRPVDRRGAPVARQLDLGPRAPVDPSRAMATDPVSPALVGRTARLSTSRSSTITRRSTARRRRRETGHGRRFGHLDRSEQARRSPRRPSGGGPQADRRDARRGRVGRSGPRRHEPRRRAKRCGPRTPDHRGTRGLPALPRRPAGRPNRGEATAACRSTSVCGGNRGAPTASCTPTSVGCWPTSVGRPAAPPAPPPLRLPPRGHAAIRGKKLGPDTVIVSTPWPKR